MHRQKVVAPSKIKISLLLLSLYILKESMVVVPPPISSKDKSLCRENDNGLVFSFFF